MQLSEDQKNQVRKDLAFVQKTNQDLTTQINAFNPDGSYVGAFNLIAEYLNNHYRALETLAIACGVFEVEREADNGG